MKSANSREIKEALQASSPKQLIELCLRLVRFKKENKELLTYLLFEADNEQSFIETVKSEMDEAFRELTPSYVYFTKKSLRKVLRNTMKYVRYMGSRQAEVELLIHFCSNMISFSIPYKKNVVLGNMFQQQLKKIDKAIETLHEDLQHDYAGILEKLQA